MKISRILLAMVILGSVLSFDHFIEQNVKAPIQTAADRVGA
ncbi:hypothetical protein BSP2_40150 [Bacillus subtilis subsp. subtilis]|nr:hypothetical protein BSP2_40150 [Bacillus subtilis subsp. subtilis]